MKGLQPLALLPAFPRLPVLVCGGGGLGELEGLEENLLFVLEQFIWSPPPFFFFVLVSSDLKQIDTLSLKGSFEN